MSGDLGSELRGRGECRPVVDELPCVRGIRVGGNFPTWIYELDSRKDMEKKGNEKR